MKLVKTIGITGGIGSGKTRVAQYLEHKGIRIFNSDIEAKHILETNTEVKTDIIQLLGNKAYSSDGKPDRAFIASIVFQQPEALKALNAIVHPATIQAFQDWQNACPDDYPHAFQCKEAAILYESGTDAGLDAVVCIYAPKTLRLKRIISRDQISTSEILARMDKQWPDAQKMLRCDYIVFNDEKHALQPQLDQLISTLNHKFGS